MCVMAASLCHSQQDEGGVTATVKTANGDQHIRGAYLVGCDGGSSAVRKQLGIKLEGDANLLELRQALYRCDELWDRIPIGKGGTITSPTSTRPS